MLKGGGWYVSDYGYRKGISEDGGAPAGSASDASAGEAKPAEAAKTDKAEAAPATAEKSAPAEKTVAKATPPSQAAKAKGGAAAS